MSESEFEEIGYSDFDSDEENAKYTNAKVVVEIPPQLIAISQSNSCLPSNPSSEAHAKKEFNEDSNSSKSSFIPVTRLNCLSIKEDKKSSKSWTKVYKDKIPSSKSHSNLESNTSVNSLSISKDDCEDELSAASSTFTGFHLLSYNEKHGKKNGAVITDRESTLNDDVASVYSWNSTTASAPLSASSVISGFDILSLNRKSKRCCRRCTFLNLEKCTICKGCGAALVANPCLDIDEQIALHLHRKEEHDAFQRLRESEKRRNNLSNTSLFEKSKFLADDIRTCIGTSTCIGIEVLPAIDLTLHVSSFIEYFERHPKSCPKICYYFSPKFPKFDTSFGYNSIRVKGFESFHGIHQDIESAYKWNDTRFNKLFSINENISSTEETDMLGWFVATFKGSRNQGDLNNSDISIRVKKPSQFIPLATFDASMRGNEAIQVFAFKLQRIIQHFFSILNQPIKEAKKNEDVEKKKSHQPKNSDDDNSIEKKYENVNHAESKINSTLDGNNLDLLGGKKSISPINCLTCCMGLS